MKDLGLRNITMMALVASCLMQVGAQLFAFFEKALKINPNVSLIKGTVCGIRMDDLRPFDHRPHGRHGKGHEKQERRCSR